MKTKRAPSSGPPWWTRPSALNLLFLMPMLLLVVWAGAQEFGGLEIRARHYLTAQYIALCAALVLVSAVGAWLGEQMPQRTVLQGTDQTLVRGALWLGALVLATYLFWFRSFLFNPPLLLSILKGVESPERSAIGTVAGVTSLVNFAPVFFGLAGYLLFVRKIRDRMLIACTAVVMLFTLTRVYIWSERLALVEAVIPLALALLTHTSPKPEHKVRSFFYWLGPYAALPAVFLFFAFAELFRSWSYYDARMGFWEFALGRFVSYYYTSLNNGAGMLTTADWPNATFQHVLLWLHKFPLGIGLAFSDIVGLNEFNMENPPTAATREFLQRYGDPEFNTPSSFLSVTFDLGVAGALLYFFITMFIGGILCSRYLKGDLVAVLLYPSVLVALFESFRYPYWGTSRAVVWLLGTVVVVGVLWMLGAVKTARFRTDSSG
jgi:hypothetical protein